MGINRFSKFNRRTVLRAFFFTSALIVADSCINIVIEPVLGKPNLSSLEGIKHDTVEYIITLIIVWVFASFGKEFLFRGYYMKWLAEFFGNKNGSWVLSGIITFLYFGISHFYQRSAGMVSIVIWSLIISVIFYHNRKILAFLYLSMAYMIPMDSLSFIWI